ncbi:1-acyl-sn-glycerol-3-phosphate acyltransferase [Nocardioides sp. zg-536]|uniref:1-acyl-sn-glycerol-3-phosphate acyltransferase n=1 Tax=Nocardioides faecalis TaxID=2803858 RepID=A0A938Y765_9ACTN|nr:lysophospholipid acyltransferase family protein [Nocardioides faecalis]MBM9460454.1 1-acyl-sn-glycerol-3-phosphate acyltransferase [Nocardioides faecalis]MBS4751379.1 1-acyl-sn-glycerol-3-phosphate acyltransferase [Nocardioides faecalis]QVI59728.1 1-acyl-sn-glycerol-3-phosphate acyltransferase [Nocardioides faecalis]
MTVRKLGRRRGWAFNIAVPIIKPFLLSTTRREWIGGENLPETGGCIIALNHISHLDPLTAAHLVYDHGRLPRYLAKSGLFDNKALGVFLRGAGQIPVKRDSRDAVGAYAAAVAAVQAGECVVIYPEATITRDPGMWPMRAKSGAARIALETGCPVIPVGQWGAHEILAPYTKRPKLVPRHQITMRVGEPVPLDDLRAQPRTPAVVNAATDRIMDAITRQLELVRNEKAPAERYDMAVQGDRFKKNKK